MIQFGSNEGNEFGKLESHLWKAEHYIFALLGWYLFNGIFQKKLSEKLPL